MDGLNHVEMRLTAQEIVQQAVLGHMAHACVRCNHSGNAHSFASSTQPAGCSHCEEGNVACEGFRHP